MSLNIQINNYLDTLPQEKQQGMRTLHQLLLSWMPNCKLWFETGLDSNNKVVSNPNIGYGECEIPYKSGKTRTFYQIGLCANTAGISIYIMGIRGKLDLAQFAGNKLGKAKITGYCIKFKKLNDIDLNELNLIILEGQKASQSNEPAH